jgi:7-cyano-7-deazaguanine synthase
MKGLIVYSGGLDSTVLLHFMRDEIIAAVNFYYGSKHNEMEREMARYNCTLLDVPLYELDIQNIFVHSKSTLLKGRDAIPEGHYEDETMKQTVVPFRNGIMLSIAAGIAESIGASHLLLANHAGDHAIYPDCRPEFSNAINKAINFGTDGKVQVHTPFLYFSKRTIAKIGLSLNIDFNKTYSCYNGGINHCGVCGTCNERIEALRDFDPTHYEK